MSLAREMQSQLPAQAVLGIQGTNASVAGAGTTQATATALAAQYNRITSGAALSGVVLPASMGIGDEIEVVNATTSNICVYPPSGGKLNANSANVPMVMAPLRCHTFFCADGTSWDTDCI